MRPRRNFGVLRRYQAPSGVGGGAAFFGPVDAMASAGAPALAAYSWSHRLSSAYTGPLFRYDRADSPTTQADAEYAAGTNTLDETSFAPHCGANDGRVVDTYDQSGNAFDVTQGTASQRPKIYDGATLNVLKQGTLPWCTFDGAAGQNLNRGDSLGLSGSPAMTLATIANVTGTGRRGLILIGSGAAPGAFYAMQEQTTLRPTNYNAASASAFRGFTPNTALTTPTGLVHRIGAGALISASTCRQDGADLAQATVAGSAGVTLGTGFIIGAASTGGTHALAGGMAAAFVVDADLAGAALTALESFFADLKALT